MNTSLPSCSLIAQLGGESVGFNGRVKDYTFVQMFSSEANDNNASQTLLIITAGSEGSVRMWAVKRQELNVDSFTNPAAKAKAPQVGRLIGQYETGNRITCLEAFLMSGNAQGDEEEANDDQREGVEESESEASSSDSSE
jgi:protein MAK11